MESTGLSVTKVNDAFSNGETYVIYWEQAKWTTSD